MMRRILVDHARKRQAAKRDAAAWKVQTGDGVDLGERDPELLALDAALSDLEALDPRQARIVEMRFFGGLTVEETAEVAGISPATVKREWQTARAWLAREIRPSGT
jgi:RNA polymerase sigma factor (TIGR02999 family)